MDQNEKKYVEAVAKDPSSSKTPQTQSEKIGLALGSRVKHVIAVLSGKGGVGKTFASSYLAVLLNRLGQKVAILDADITGASIPTAFGINDVKMYSTGDVIYPAVSLTGIQISSANLLIDHPDDPVIWRGPMAASLVLQFYSQVAYDADIMIIDCPPGTSDIQLSVLQRLPIDGIVLAMTPQGLVNTIANKAYKMAGMLNIPILGAIMNMSYFICPDCHKEVYPFGEVDMDVITKANIPLVSRVPFDSKISDYTDHGEIEKLQVPYLDNMAQGIMDFCHLEDKENDR